MGEERDQFKSFRRQLGHLMDRCRLTAYGLGKETSIDPTFIYRLLSGERNPSRSTVLNLAQALYEYSTVITQRDAERLIQSSGFPPPRRVP